MLMNHANIKGLTAKEVIQSRKKNGENKLSYKKEHTFLDILLELIKDPMMILLLVAASIYFISGKTGDGIFLVVAIVFQTSISLYQSARSKNALEKLNDLSQPNCKVIREGKVVEIKSEAVVVGDCLLIEEGTAITADGIIIHSNDFST